MDKLGYQILVTILLPGAILLSSVSLVLQAVMGPAAFTALKDQLMSKEWVGAGVMLLSAALLGTLLGSVLDALEDATYDVQAAERLGLSPEAYWEEWLKYVDSLETRANPYIDQMALYFFFESRTAAATLVLGLVWVALAGLTWGILWGVLLLGVAYGLLVVSRDTHMVLAEYRHRHFEKRLIPRSKPRKAPGPSLPPAHRAPN